MARQSRIRDHVLACVCMLSVVTSSRAWPLSHSSQDVVIVNSTAERPEARKEGRSLDSLQPSPTAQTRIIDPLTVLKPVAGILNGDFGLGLVAPSIPGYKDDGTNPAASIAAAYSPVEPLIAPFRPAAMAYTGATYSDLNNLRPQQDLVYPFLDPPKNVLLAATNDKKLRDASTDAVMSEASRLSPGQLASYQKAVEAWKLAQLNAARINALRGDAVKPQVRDFGFGFGGFPGYGLGLGYPGVGGNLGLQALTGVGPASVPVNPFVAPFYPFALGITGASPSDLTALNSQHDLVYPFLSPPYNTLLPIKDKDKDKDKFVLRAGTSPLVPQQVSTLVRTLAEKLNQVERSPKNTTQEPFQKSRSFGVGALGAPGTGFLDKDVLEALIPLSEGFGPFPRPITDLVLPFLPADKNPFLSLLYYVTPPPLRSGATSSVREFGLSSGFSGLGVPGGFGVGVPNYLDKNVLEALSPLSTGFGPFPRPITDLVLPFLPADKNPFLSLLYYITPAPLRTKQRMAVADQVIAADVASRTDLSPAEAIERAHNLQGIVAAAELHHTLSKLGLKDVSKEILRTFMPSIAGSSGAANSREQLVSSLKSNKKALDALRLSPFEDFLDTFDFDSGKDDDKKLGKIPGAAPILHYFYPYLPKKVLKPFKPVVEVRDGVLDGFSTGFAGLNALGLNPFEDFLDSFDGGKDDDKKLGKIPGAAPILHYFYPYLPKKVLKPFKPVVDLRSGAAASAANAADLQSLLAVRVADALNERLFEVKYAAAVAAMKKARYQQRLLDAIARTAPASASRHGKQFFDAESENEGLLGDKQGDDGTTSVDFGEVDGSFDFESDSLKSAGNAADGDNSVAGDGKEEMSADDLFAGQEKSPLAQVFRFLVPELNVEDSDLEAAQAAEHGKGLLESRELKPDSGLSTSLDFLQNAVEENAPFPLNDIFRWWTQKRGFRSSFVGPQGRSLKAEGASPSSSMNNSSSFAESFRRLRSIQKRSLRLNDTFAAESLALAHANGTEGGTSRRQGRQLGFLAGLLPFPFNLLSYFLPFRDAHGVKTSGASGDESGVGAEVPADGSVGEDEQVPDALDDQYEVSFKESGISPAEGDRRMASMIGPFLPQPLNAAVGALFPFRSFEQDIEAESNIEEGTGGGGVQEESEAAMKRFQDSLQAIREEYLNKQQQENASLGQIAVAAATGNVGS